MSRVRARYGASPWHLAGVAVTLALTAYAISGLLEMREPLNFALWFVGAIVVHDLVGYPAYAAVGNLVFTRTRPAPAGWVNAVRVPGLLSALLFLVWFPSILDLQGANVVRAAREPRPDYLARWLALTAALFAASAVVVAIARLRRRRL